MRERKFQKRLIIIRKFEHKLFTFNVLKMENNKLNHAHPKLMEIRYIEEVRKMSPQQRFEKLMAIIELAYLLKTSKKISK